MELSLIRNLMDKDFYDGNKGTRCPDKLFTKDVQKIKYAIDNAMENYERSVSPEEVEALFLSAIQRLLLHRSLCLQTCLQN